MVKATTRTKEPGILSKRTCGPRHRFAVVEFRTRFGSVEYHVEDAETPDPVAGGLPSIVFQGTKEGAEALVAKADAEYDAANPEE